MVAVGRLLLGAARRDHALRRATIHPRARNQREDKGEAREYCNGAQGKHQGRKLCQQPTVNRAVRAEP